MSAEFTEQDQQRADHSDDPDPDPDAGRDPEKTIAELKEKLFTEESDLETQKNTLIRLRKFLIKNRKFLYNVLIRYLSFGL
jgi:hypothetical protein